MVLIQSYPLSERNFDDALIPFDSDKVLFNNLIGTGFGISATAIYNMAFARNVLSNIRITTAYVKVCFARRLTTTFTTNDTAKYYNHR